MSGIITFLSDFGSTSGYPAAMKGVAAGISEARLIDITHDIERHNIREGAFVLWMVAPYFPNGTIHCAVVDPGVGTQRRGLILKAGGQLFVGPDNGLLWPAANRVNKLARCQGHISIGQLAVYAIENVKYMRPEISDTFHGRDIFAPVAAHLANGVPPEEIGKLVDECVKLGFGEGVKRGDVLLGEVIYIDSFGNVITNIESDLLKQIAEFGDGLVLEAARKTVSVKFLPAYGFADESELFLTIGSHGNVEIAKNLGRAAQELRLKVGEGVRIAKR